MAHCSRILRDALLCATLICPLAACTDGVHQNSPSTPADAASNAPDAPTDPGADTARPPAWAVPLERPGLPNLHRVSDPLYRGAQPREEGWAELKEMGVRAVVNLRLTRSDRDETEEHGLDYVHIRMEAWDADHDELVEFLRFVQNPRNQPVFVHCKHGADRTGLACAVYRVTVQGWSPREAAREMQDGGYGFHRVWGNLPDYIEELDTDRLRRDAGLGEAAHE